MGQQQYYLTKYGTDKIKFIIKKEQMDKLAGIARTTGNTMEAVFLSLVRILLEKSNECGDIILKKEYRSLQEDKSISETILHTKKQIDLENSYEEYLEQIIEQVEIVENQCVQLERDVKTQSELDDININSLYDLVLMVSDAEKEWSNTKDLAIDLNNIEIKDIKISLTFLISEADRDLTCILNYYPKKFDRETIEIMVERFKYIIEAITEDISVKVGKIHMISAKERSKILYEFNDTYVDYRRDMTIHELFEIQANRTPNNIAIEFEEKKLTYMELNEKSNRLATTLREKGIKKDNIVGMMVEKSIEMIVGMLAILKAGGAYLPINLQFPKDRIKYMLEDSNAKILLTQDGVSRNDYYQVENIDLNDQKYYGENNNNLENITSSNDLAYVIYTSGTTGKQKGVMVEHKQVNNFIQGIRDSFSIEDYSNILCLTDISFDIFVLETLMPLTNGLKVTIAKEEHGLSGESVSEIILKNNIEIIQCTPSRIKILMESSSFRNALCNIKIVLIGGDTLSINLVRQLEEYKNLNIYNMYGPTETTVWSTLKRMNGNEHVTIGKPINNTKIYILDENNDIVPIGISGELCIGGEGVTRGYLNNHILTSEKFIRNPYDLEEIIYKTGDLARWLPNGDIELLGRMDYQVKVNGYRIETAEIENLLLTVEGIKDSVVVAREENQDKHLCGYFIADRKYHTAQLKEELKKSLPEYMIPTFFVQLDKFPLTLNGKLDRKALPSPYDSIESGYDAPENKIQHELVKMWKKVFDIRDVGIKDNFFDLGGNSLKLTMLIGQIYKQFNVNLTFKEIYNLKTIKELSELIEVRGKTMFKELTVVEPKEYYDVSSTQKKMFITYMSNIDSVSYNEIDALLITGKLDFERLEAAFNRVLERHEALRTSFFELDGNIMQKVHAHNHISIKCINIASECKATIDEEIESFIKPFDLKEAPLIRAEMLMLCHNKNLLIWDIHHINYDGISRKIFIEELVKIYKNENILEPKHQYKDYSEWHNGSKLVVNSDKKENYWLKQLSGEISILNLPVDYSSSNIKNYEGNYIDFNLEGEVLKQLKKLSSETNTTIYMILLSVYSLLLSKYSGQEDIIIGAATSGRTHIDMQEIIGLFANVLPMRTYPKGDKRYIDFLQETKNTCIQSLDNQDFQVDKLLKKLCVNNYYMNELFNVGFVFDDSSFFDDLSMKDLLVEPYKVGSKSCKYDITLYAQERAESIEFRLEYCTSLFKHSTIQRMVGHFTNLIEIIPKKLENKISQISITTESEKELLLNKFNNTQKVFIKDKTVTQVFEDVVDKFPDSIAVVSEDVKLTYKELNEKASQLGKVLRDNGISAGDVIGVMLPRNYQVIVSIIAILKIGGTYLPLDMDYPNERLQYMINDSGAKLLLTQSNLGKDLNFDGKSIFLDYIKLNDIHLSENEFGSILHLEDVAYIIYTSGSTGRPKGVMVQHKGLLNLRTFFLEELMIKDTDRILQFASFSFDASIWEIFMSLFSGATLYVLSKEIIMNYEEFENFINRNEITVATLPPTYLVNVNVDKIITLTKLITAGSETSFELLNKWKSKVEYINAYGPTETTICATIWRAGEQNYDDYITVPIGRPICNTQVYILDKCSNLQPIGIVGELCIAGESITKGYKNLPDITREKFVKNEFNLGGILYKSGDLARWLPDGNIEFVGRIDNQVKIRGFRVELGEIDNHLLKYDDIIDCCTIHCAEQNSYLCSYVISNKLIDGESVKEYLFKKLPNYMVPAYILQVDKIPLTINGKVDKEKLPKPNSYYLDKIEYEEPSSIIEKVLADLWGDLLSHDQIGVNDNFLNLGGDSIKAALLIGRIKSKLNVTINLNQIFKTPTIRLMADFIDKSRKSFVNVIRTSKAKEYYNVSSAQKRMYTLYSHDPNSTSYNLPEAIMIEGQIDYDRLNEALNVLIKRHDSIRTSFELIDGEVKQKINEDVYIDLKYIYVEKESTSEINDIINEFIKPFDLSTVLLMRAALVRINNDKDLLLLDMHHIIYDGVSRKIFMEELIDIYEGKRLKENKYQYKDYAEWQLEVSKVDEWKEKEKYWMNQLSGELPVLNMPLDFSRPTVQSFEGDSVDFRIDEDILREINKLAIKTGTTLYMILLSVYSIMLSKYSGQEEIIVGTVSAGRMDENLQNIVGMFVNTLAIRTYPDGRNKYIDYLSEIKSVSLDAFDNQEFQFEELIGKLNLKRDISRNLLFDAMFVLENINIPTMKMDGRSMHNYKVERNISKFDMTLIAEANGTGMDFKLEYCTKLFKRTTMERMSKHFIVLLKNVLKNKDKRISDIEMILNEEKDQIINEFNDTKTVYPRNKSVSELFEEQVKNK
ncbi:MAG: amino acid adenylation domain protein, partial [Clostridiaceae bacterium]|nr:amino acid adenylation domain protein [Clostridiaceae bacterium]